VTSGTGRGEEEAMSAQKYSAVSALVFTLVAIAHLVRAIGGTPVLVGGWPAPVAVSWLAVVIAGGLAVWGFLTATRASG
jgi:hypothetical protein